MRTLKIILILSAAAALLTMSGCNVLENETTSNSVLIIQSITGTDANGQAGSPIHFSDVLSGGGGIVNDYASAALTMMLIDPGATAATYYQNIIVDQIDIHYTRSDGLNQPGQDVPYSFSQAVYIQLTMGATSVIPFVLIQHTAKMESPLIDLVDSGQEDVLKLEAHITFHGHDLAGNRVQSQTGVISVYCANFADAE